MEIAIVVQRYGKKIIGGAESHARQIAEHLAARLGWKVHVFTTTAQDYLTWKNHYPAGLETINGVLVHRYPSTTTRRPWLFNGLNRPLTKLIRACSKVPLTRPLARVLERFWYQLQGPVCPALVRDLLDQERYFDQIFFFTYLYYPTVFGLPLVKSKATLIPTAHNEAPFYFLHTKELLRAAKTILANTEAEALLIRSTYPQAAARIAVVGLGFDDELLDPENLSTIFAAPVDGRYLLYLGRISAGKNVQVLLRYFQTYLAASGDRQTKLVLAGEVEHGFVVPDHPQIHSAGFIAEDRKAKLIAKAACLVNPSPLESLSMVVIEALALKVPVLLNRESEVLADYEKTQKSVYGYDTEQGFVDALGRILQAPWDGPEQMQILAQGRQWAVNKFSWDRVLSAYKAAIDQAP